MAITNTQSIFSKCKEWSESKKGKERMKQVISQMQKDGQRVTAAGSEVLTKSRMSELADELISILRNTAASYDLPPSVLDHFESLTYVVQDLGDGEYEFDIYFADDLSRESLYTDENQGSGINNIIALFNNGYVASAPKYGWWENHKPTGESLIRSGVNGKDAYIRSLQGRQSLNFMQRAIQDFVSKYQGKYPLSVGLNTMEYDGNYAGSLNGTITKL